MLAVAIVLWIADMGASFIFAMLMADRMEP